MEDKNSTSASCSCGNKTCQVNDPAITSPIHPLKKIANFVKGLFSVLLSLLIAFFPKCPVCWGVYMSMFGGVGLAQLPYMKWLFPVLLCLFALHLVLLFRKSGKTGYGPFALSLAGAAVILTGRTFFIGEKEWLYAGMVLVLSGSLWSSFTGIRFRSVVHS